MKLRFVNFICCSIELECKGDVKTKTKKNEWMGHLYPYFVYTNLQQEQLHLHTHNACKERENLLCACDCTKHHMFSYLLFNWWVFTRLSVLGRFEWICQSVCCQHSALTDRVCPIYLNCKVCSTSSLYSASDLNLLNH